MLYRRRRYLLLGANRAAWPDPASRPIYQKRSEIGAVGSHGKEVPDQSGLMNCGHKPRVFGYGARKESVLRAAHVEQREQRPAQARAKRVIGFGEAVHGSCATADGRAAARPR